MTLVGTVFLVAAILIAWLLGALLVGLAVGRILGETQPRPFRHARGDYDTAA